MKALAALALALTFLCVRAEPVEALPSAISTQANNETPDQVARRYHLAGEMLVAKGARILLDRGYDSIAPTGGTPHKPGERWRLMSITKQVFAVRVLQALARRNRSLDDPLVTGLSARALLTHHTGLANPSLTPVVGDEFPAFYRAPVADLDFCRSVPARPGADFSYNNCDYLVLADALRLQNRWPAGMRMARPCERTLPGYIKGRLEPDFNLGVYGASGGLIGTLPAVWTFDRELMTGKLLPPPALAELWKPEGNGSAQALGQWVFSGQLKGCAAPKRIVQRDGEIGGVQARNYILPDDDLVVIVFANRSADDFKLGEVWEQSGFVYDLLSAAACS